METEDTITISVKTAREIRSLLARWESAWHEIADVTALDYQALPHEEEALSHWGEGHGMLTREETNRQIDEAEKEGRALIELSAVVAYELVTAINSRMASE